MKSIIIPVYNLPDTTHECLYSVLENTQDCEIIIVDNGSEPPYVPPFSGFTPITVIRNEENKGFPVAVNQGIQAAKGDVIILLNNDVIVTPGWTERLICWLNDFAIVGPVTNYCAGLQRVTLPAYTTKEGLYKEAEFYAEENKELALEVNWIIGFCMVFKKALYDELGAFDESLWPCSGEEIDFALRAREKGYKVGIICDVYAHHFGSQTFNELINNGTVDYEEICERNNLHLAEKWGPDFQIQEIGRKDIPRITGEGIRLNLGCGYAKIDGYTNIDNRKEVDPDLVCDVLDGLPYGDNTVDEIRAFDFLEHISLGRTIDVITEIWRVLKLGGKFESFTPSTDGRGAFQDPTHASFWNRNSWLYYSDAEYRALYGIKANFEIITIEDTQPDPRWKIVHTHVIAIAKK